MPFGLCNAPATFQRLMLYCFKDEIFIILVMFLDDNIVYSKDIGTQLKFFDRVFEILR